MTTTSRKLSLSRPAALALGVLFALGACASAQAGDPATLIQEKLVTQITLTKAAADHSNIVTPGDMVVLHKDGLMMCSSASAFAYSNTYNNGVLTPNQKNRALDSVKHFGLSYIPVLGGGGSASDAANNACTPHTFVAGEKFWVTEVVAQKGGILVKTFSEPYPDSSGNKIRYYGEIAFPFAKHSAPSVEDFVKTVSEVITVQPADDSGQPAQAAASAAAPAPAFMPDTPPPPPSDTPPPTIALGQTKDQVTAALGQPTRRAKVGVKEIFFYKDQKVTFTNGKVSDVE
jgi:hypothetical protein